MLNRCKTEYAYKSLAKSGGLPSEGFRESTLSLSPILRDPEFESLVHDAEGGKFTVFDVLGTSLSMVAQPQPVFFRGAGLG